MTFKNWVSPQSVRSYRIKCPFVAIRLMVPFYMTTTLTTYTTSYDAICKYMHFYTFCKLVTGFIVVALLMYRLLFSPRGWNILLYSGNTKAIGALSTP